MAENSAHGTTTPHYIGDRHDRCRVLHSRPRQWANEGATRRRCRCGWRPKTCRGAPRIRRAPPFGIVKAFAPRLTAVRTRLVDPAMSSRPPDRRLLFAPQALAGMSLLPAFDKGRTLADLPFAPFVSGRSHRVAVDSRCCVVGSPAKPEVRRGDPSTRGRVEPNHPARTARTQARCPCVREVRIAQNVCRLPHELGRVRAVLDVRGRPEPGQATRTGAAAVRRRGCGATLGVLRHVATARRSSSPHRRPTGRQSRQMCGLTIAGRPGHRSERRMNRLAIPPLSAVPLARHVPQRARRPVAP
jgi:hypothetical protein